MQIKNRILNCELRQVRLEAENVVERVKLLGSPGTAFVEDFQMCNVSCDGVSWDAKYGGLEVMRSDVQLK